MEEHRSSNTSSKFMLQHDSMSAMHFYRMLACCIARGCLAYLLLQQGSGTLGTFTVRHSACLKAEAFLACSSLSQQASKWDLHVGKTRDFGESPVKRSRLAKDAFATSQPATSSTAELHALGESLVAAESVPSQQALDCLVPGAAVEYRSRHPYFVGGWFCATIVQVTACFAPLPMAACPTSFSCFVTG